MKSLKVLLLAAAAIGFVPGVIGAPADPPGLAALKAIPADKLSPNAFAFWAALVQAVSLAVNNQPLIGQSTLTNHGGPVPTKLVTAEGPPPPVPSQKARVKRGEVLEKRQALNDTDQKSFNLAVFKLYVDRLALEGANLTLLCDTVNVTALTDDGIEGPAASSYLCAKVSAPATSTTGSITVANSVLSTVPLKSTQITSIPTLSSSSTGGIGPGSAMAMSTGGTGTGSAMPIPTAEAIYSNATSSYSYVCTEEETVTSAAASSSSSNVTVPYGPVPSSSVVGAISDSSSSSSFQPTAAYPGSSPSFGTAATPSSSQPSGGLNNGDIFYFYTPRKAVAAPTSSSFSHTTTPGPIMSAYHHLLARKRSDDPDFEEIANRLCLAIPKAEFFNAGYGKEWQEFCGNRPSNTGSILPRDI